MSEDSKPDPTIDPVLREACDRNVNAELHFRDGDDQLVVLHSRMLSFDDERVWLLRPSIPVAHVERFARCQFEVFFEVSDKPCVFVSALINCHARLAINEQKAVDAVAIRRPDEIEEVQRRKEFRVFLAGTTPLRAIGHDAGPSSSCDSVGLDPLRCEGDIVDLSPSGASVLLDRNDVSFTPLESRVFLEFPIPDAEGRVFAMLAEVRHLRSVQDGAAVRLGLKFLPYPTLRRFQRVQDQIYRSLMAVQRKQARRAG